MGIEAILVAILVLSYIGFCIYAAKGGNLFIGFFVMAILWSVVAGGNIDYIANTVLQKGADGYGATAVLVIIGSWFGRVLVETGIAGSIIRRTVELGGDKPAITTILLSLVVMLIFTSTFGVGAVIAIGVIALPILMSLGVPKRLAVSSYVMSVGAGMYLNRTLFAQMQLIFTDLQFDNAWIKFGTIAMCVQFVIIVIMILFYIKRDAVRTWSAPAGGVQNVPMYAMLVPIVPVLMSIVFKWAPVPGLFLAVILAFLLTGNMRSFTRLGNMIQKTLQDGVSDIATLLGLLLVLAMFNPAATKAVDVVKQIIGGTVDVNPWMVAVLVGVLAPLALFRGPLMVWGVGAATATVFTGILGFPTAVALPLIYVPTISMAISCCPTQSWNMWAAGYMKLEIGTFIKTGVPFGWITVLINILIAMAVFA